MGRRRKRSRTGGVPKRQSSGTAAGSASRDATGARLATVTSGVLEEPGWQRLYWLVAALVALVAYRSARSFELVGDARFLIAENRFVRSFDYFWDTLTHDYFWSSSGQIIPYWRPLTKLSWLLEWRLFGPWAGGYALVNAGWHAFATAGVALLANRVGLGRLAATAVAVVFALHPVAIEPVSLVMARSDVVASAAMIWSVLTWLVWRERLAAGRALAPAFAHVAFVVLALGSKESSIVLPVVLGLWALALGDARRDSRSRLRTLLPSAVLGLSYFVLRRALLERVAPGLSSTSLVLDPSRVVASLSLYLRGTWPLSFGSPVREIPIAEARSGHFLALAALTLGSLVAAIVWSVRRRERALGALIGWTLLALAPVLFVRDIAVVAAADRYALADRWLYQALAPALLVWALLARAAYRAWARGVEPERERAVALGAVGVVALWAAWLLFRSDADRAELASDLAMIDNEDRVFYQAIPVAFRTHWDDCRHEERELVKRLMRARPDEALARGRDAAERCPDHPEVQLYYLDALVQAGRFEQAEPVARRLIASPPRDLRNHGRLAWLTAVTLLQRGDTRGARPLFEKAVLAGQATCRSFVALAEAARAAKRVGEAAEHLEAAFQCGGRKDASLRVAAATWLVQAGERERARAVLASLSGATLSSDQAEQVAALEKAVASGSAAELMAPVPAAPAGPAASGGTTPAPGTY